MFPSWSGWPQVSLVEDPLALSSWPWLSDPAKLTTYGRSCGSWPVLGPFYSLSLEGSGGRSSNLSGRWSSWQVEVDVREPHSFYRYAPNSKLEETDPYTQIAPPPQYIPRPRIHSHNEQCGSSRQVSQAQLHTTFYITLYPNPGLVNQNQHNWWWASDHTRVQPHWLHKQHTQRGIPASTRFCWEYHLGRHNL